MLFRSQDIRDQCQVAAVSFFFKQVGGRTSKAGGRLLDGRIWDEMPQAWEQHNQKWGNTPIKYKKQSRQLELIA